MAGIRYESEFHKRYVGGEGEVEEGQFLSLGGREIVPMTIEEILAHYRDYVKDPEAELPEALVKVLKLHGRIKKDE